MATCNVLQSRDVIPLGIGLKDPWPVFAWFTYVTLRTQGLTFYQQLLKGDISWQDPRVVSVMDSWLQLKKHCPYTENFTHYGWRLPSKSLLRKQVGMVLNGSFIMHLFNADHANDIGFFRFPDLQSLQPLEEIALQPLEEIALQPSAKSMLQHTTESTPLLSAEIAPVEVWIVPSRSPNIEIAKAFIGSFLQEKTITDFNVGIDYLSPHKNSPEPDNEVMRQGSALLKAASGLTSFFDRDAPPRIVKLAEDVFIQFLTDENIDGALHKLEAARLAYYKASESKASSN